MEGPPDNSSHSRQTPVAAETKAAADEVARQELPQQPLLPGLAAKAAGLDAIRSALVDAASATAGIWLSYLFALFYLLIAAAGVTHRDLFFENPVKLPFFNVDLPLKGFFWLGPALLLILHVYVLLHFVLLAGKAALFNTALRAQVDDQNACELLRAQLPPNIFVQLLTGPCGARRGLIGFLLQLITWITVVIGPIALLVLFQLQFLPYHDASITFWHRASVVIDLGLLWSLWPPVARGFAIGSAWRSKKILTIGLTTIMSLTIGFFVFVVAAFPGERLERLATIHAIKVMRDFLIAGDVDLAARKPTSIWSNRLVLPELDVVDHIKFDTESKIASIPVSVSLRTRDLRGAVLIGAYLRSVDFTGADLRDARLDRADLRGAKMACEEVSLKNQSNAEQGCVRLQNSILDRADLRGVSLIGAQLQGASLEAAQLQGVSLNGANLLGAELMDANLQGATLYGSKFQGAHLFGAQLQGASADYANFQGADLETADLRAASLQVTQLQGADLDRANLESALLVGDFVWRAEVRPTRIREADIDTKGARIDDVETRPQFVCDKPNQLRSDVCTWSISDYEDLRQRVAGQVSSDIRRQEVLRRIESLNVSRPLKGEEEMAQRWIALTKSSPLVPTYQAGLARELAQIGCEIEAPYVLDAIISRLGSNISPFEDPILGNISSVESERKLVVTFLDNRRCAGMRRLSDSEQVRLKELLTTPDRGRHTPLSKNPGAW
jgi:uncharacterized protein YjbI with pentapeptide repeats